MSETVETQETPQWLKDLERKREQRLKARLGHEAGAGAPCLKCNEKCSGLDLHFWRKICKNCKCSKEDHDVHDDDIYGWAQFQLLGSKPSQIRKKIVLPGKKDEVELEWAPKGNTETIDRYLKTLAPEALPVKGSQAAQERKQLLQKQIPIHDIDPSFCHELTENELAKMQDYIKNMKISAGVGQIIQFGVKPVAREIVTERYPKGIPSIEAVPLLGERKTGTLTRQLEGLTIQDLVNKIPKPHSMTAHGENLNYNPLTAKAENLGYLSKYDKNLPYNYSQKEDLSHPNQNYSTPLDIFSKPPSNLQPPTALPPLPPDYTEINQNVTSPIIGYAREHILNDFSGLGSNYVAQIPSESSLINQGAESVYVNQIPGYGAELAYANQIPGYGAEPAYAKQIPGYGAEPAYANKIPSYGAEPTQVKQIPGYGAEPAYVNQVSGDPKYNYGAVPNLEINRNLPHYAPGKLNIQKEQQNPTRFGTIRDITHGTNSNCNKTLPGYNPNQYIVPENELMPNQVKIGAIRDISYDDNPEVRRAIQGENNLFEPSAAAPKVPEDVEIQTKQCHKCKKFFDVGEFAIFVEKSNALYHSACFKCAGCNQSLADLFYFYDKESDNVYCGRDFAKIRGVPRCKACDELIFVKEYCLAENSTFHLKHFCCFECDTPLAGQNYVVEDSQPLCLPCYEKLKASKCTCCGRVIKPDEQGVALSEKIHFHAEVCFACSVCRKTLHGAKFLFKNQKLYCSHECFKSGQ